MNGLLHEEDKWAGNGIDKEGDARDATRGCLVDTLNQTLKS